MSKSRTKLAAVLPRPPTPRLALSILEFCVAHGISEGFFYKLKKQGEGPRAMKVGARTLITFESAAQWRREREIAVPQHDRARGAEQILRRENPEGFLRESRSVQRRAENPFLLRKAEGKKQ